MSCEEIQNTLSAYLDGDISPDGRVLTEAHLAECPVCRTHLEETRTMLRALSMTARPVAPPDLAASISAALMAERTARRTQSPVSLRENFWQWIEMRLMPYTVGALASTLLFFAVSSALRPHFRALRDITIASRTPESVIFIHLEGGYDVNKPVSLMGYVESRTPYGVESPSLNPRGALAELTWTPSPGRPGDDDMVVVADVYGNGSASLAEIVEPPRNPRMIAELEDAFRKNPAFVPASLDHRPQTMRVIFAISKMNVRERSF